MAYFQFLGTGPSTPILDANGRNRRTRSAALMQHISTYILIDATHDFEEQVDTALSVTAVCITNPSRDAAGGLGNLDRWVDGETPVHVPADLWADLLNRYGPFQNLTHVPTPVGEATPLGDLNVTAFAVGCSTGEDAPPTYGYHFDTGKKRVAYVSDVKHLPEESEPYLHDNDLLIVDGAGWDKDLPTHRGALNHLHAYATWGNAQIVFTNIGRSAPPHTQAAAIVRRMSPRATVAYDRMKLPLGR